MTNAFEPGDPALELAALGKSAANTVLEEDDQPWIRKAEQLKIDGVRIFHSIVAVYHPQFVPQFGSQAVSQYHTSPSCS